MATNDAARPSARDLRRADKGLHRQVKDLAERAASLYPPHTNSAIAHFDAGGFHRAPVSILVVNALQSAAAHLVAMRTFARTSQANRLTALSLMRPALMASTLAGWLLLPEEPLLRTRRAVGLSLEHLGYEETYLGHVSRIERAEIDERLAFCTAKRSELNEWATSNGVQPIRFKMTSAVAEVANTLTPDQQPWLEAIWVEQSSAAHGYGWHVETRTYGAGSEPIEGTAFNRFSMDLNKPEYLDHLAIVIDYAATVLSVAEAMFADITQLADTPENASEAEDGNNDGR